MHDYRNLINSTINVLKQFWHFNALVVSQYVNMWKSASAVEYCAVQSLSSALILIHPYSLAILFFDQNDYHQLQKICSWSASFGYIEYVYIHKIYFMGYYTSNKIFCSYFVTKKLSNTGYHLWVCTWVLEIIMDSSFFTSYPFFCLTIHIL